MIYALVAGLILGCVGTWFVHRDELKYLRTELRAAQDRITGAVFSGEAIVPPRAEEPVEIEPLPSELMECVNQWESPESRALEEHKIRGWLAEGWGNEAILRQYNAA